MKPMSLRKQKGFFLFLAVILVLVLGFMGTTIVYLFANRAQLSVAELKGLKTFYLAESGLEAAARYLTRSQLEIAPTRITCASLTGNSQLTNATIGEGTFTATTINSSPTYAISTLSAAESATDTTINVTSTAAFAPTGRVVIDRENIDYAGISGNTLVNVIRGTNRSIPAAHAAGAGVGEYQCSVNVDAGIPNVASSKYERTVQGNIQLQDAWAVGNTGSSQFSFSRWNRPSEMDWTFSTVAGGSSAANLTGVSMLSNGEGWAVGEGRSNTLILMRWNGSSWVLNTIPTTCTATDLFDVSMVSSQQGWAVGEGYSSLANCSNSSFRHLILRWNGSAWSILTPTSIPADVGTRPILRGVSVIDTNADGLGNIGFAVGDAGIILQYNGTNWVKVTSPVTSALNGVFTVSASEAWAVGNNGVILRWNGSSWSSFSSPLTTQINKIAMIDTNGDGLADMGWAVANSERILTYNGSTWSYVDLGGSNLYGVGIFDTNDVWAAGASGLVVHWNGTSWVDGSSGTTRQFNAIGIPNRHIQPLSNWRQIFG